MLLVAVTAITATSVALPVSAHAATSAQQQAASPSAGGHYQRVRVDPKAYPYRHANPIGIDRWGFTERQCVSYAAWWLNAHHVKFTIATRGPSGVGHFLNADTWARATRAAGWAVSRRPRVGAIAEWRAGERSAARIDGVTGVSTAGPDGHVAVVLAVRRHGWVKVAEYNAMHPLGFDTMTVKGPRYLYIGMRRPR